MGVLAVGVSNAVLSDGAHFTCHPAREDLAALLFAKARAVEVAFDDEGDNIDDKLVFVQDRVHDDGDHGSEEVAAENFDNDDNKAAGLEDSAAWALVLW